jgi:1-acyl-sn-glycerol-3-phosphate acyltransferase
MRSVREAAPTSGKDRRQPFVGPVDMRILRRSCAILGAIGKHYFRNEMRGFERLPREQSILVANHDGGVLPINGLLFGAAWHPYHDYSRPLYVLTHDIFQRFGRGFGQLMLDSGIIPADRGHMDAAIATGAPVLVFPGAARETFRPFWQRQKIDLGGRTGFIAQAIRHGLPVTPVISAGSHETLVVLASGQKFAKAIGLPKLVRSADIWPVLLGLPWGVWALPFLPQLPLPAKITVEVLDTIRLDDIIGRRLTPADADDKTVVDTAFRHVLGVMQEGVTRLYAERRYPFIG